MIFIILNINQDIVNDSGIFSILLFSSGLILYYFSYIFLWNTSYIEYVFHYLFKHSGLFLSLMILYIIMNLNLEFGIKIKPNDNRFKNSEVYETTFNRESVRIDNFEENNLKKQNTNNESIGSIISRLKSVNGSKIFSINEKEINESVLYKINKINKLIIKVIVMYILYFIASIVVIIINKNKITTEQANDKKWYYKYELEKYDLICDIIEFLIIIVIFMMGKDISMYNNIFKHTYYIISSLRFAMVFGPLINVIIMI